MNEDELIQEDDTQKPDLLKINSECATSKKACKNCTCGRAEEEAKESATRVNRVTLAMLENPGMESSCGSCGLGDAFRCGGCPYTGLPAFKDGEKNCFT